MTLEKAREYAKSIDLTTDDKRSFEDFQPVAKQFAPFLKDGNTVLLTNSERRDILKRNVTQLFLEPVDSTNSPVKLILAFNNRNIYVDGVSLRKMGEKDIDAPISALAAFKVVKIDMTGEYPMRRSVAAEKLDLAFDKKFVDADWGKLRKLYEGDAEMRKAAPSEEWGADPRYEIPHIEIAPVE